MDHAVAAPELAGPADLPGLVVTCAAAFSDDPMIRWPMPDATPAIGPLIWFMQTADHAEHRRHRLGS